MVTPGSRGCRVKIRLQTSRPPTFPLQLPISPLLGSLGLATHDQLDYRQSEYWSRLVRLEVQSGVDRPQVIPAVEFALECCVRWSSRRIARMRGLAGIST